MKGKYFAIILTVFILMSINVAFADETGNETLMMHESALELSVEETPADILGEETGSYADLKKYIDTTISGGELKLNHDYKFNSTKDTPSAGIYTCVPITKSITIDGQGHTIDGSGCQRGILDISSNDVTLKNIVFKNGYNTGNGGCINAHGMSNFQLINCTFTDSISGTYGGAVELVSVNNVSIVSCDFINNSAKLSSVPRGGAINWVSSQGGTINGCNFIKNSALYGGAIMMEGVNGVHQYNNNFRNNRADNYGGDIMCDDKEADFHDCNFTDSYSANYGGSIYWKGGNSVMYNLHFNNVSSRSYGGAIYFTSGKNSTMKNSTFKKYTSNNGGAIYIGTSDISLIGCEFESGSANVGGTIQVSAANTVIDNCKFESTSASTNGGAIIIYSAGSGTNITNSEFKSGSANMGGAVYSNAVNVFISNNDFVNNRATIGGAVYSGSAGFSLTDNRFAANNATDHGGAVYSTGANPVFLLNTYTANRAAKQGGALFFRGSNVISDRETFIDNLAAYGGAITFDANNAQINNSYFRGNNASKGSAIFKGNNVAYINNPEFVYNQAESYSLDVERTGNHFKVIYKGNDNILNAIWNNGPLSDIFIDGVNPKASADESNDGQLLYQDSREFDQIITATVLNSEGNVIGTLSKKTDINGVTEFDINEGYSVIFAHPNDVFYTGIETIDYISGIKVEKIALTPVVVNGTQVRFQIAITNTGYYDLENLTVSEMSFEGLVYDDFEKSDLWTYDGLSWKFNSKLAAGEVALLTVYFKTTDVGEFTNKISAITAGDIKGDAEANVTVIPDTFEVKKVSLMPITKLGDQTYFEIIIRNTGDTDIRNVYIIEDSFEGLVYSHAFEDTLWDYISIEDGIHQWFLKDVLPAHEELGIVVVFNTTSIGNFTNYAIVGHEGTSKTVNATVWVNETVHEPENPNPQMNISIFTVHPVIMVDGDVWFEVIVENIGNVVLNNVTVEEFRHDNLVFAGFEIDSSLWDYKPKILTYANRVDLLGAPVENNHTWVVNTPLYQNEVLGFFVKFTSTVTGNHSNTVMGHSDETPDPLYATDHVKVLASDYTVQKIALNSTVNVGDQVTFQIVVHNTGEVAIEGMEIVENPDESLVFERWYCDGETWGNEGETHYYLWEPIAPGGYSEFFVVYSTTKAGNITNAIAVSDELFNATVEVTNKTDNQTVPGNNTGNETVPDNGTDDDGEVDPIVEPPDDSGHDIVVRPDEDSGEASASDALNAVDENATGNPVIALLVVLMTLVLIRRRY